ncbi:MAG: hypothetical protein LBD01_06940 [Puniceicoccales bacterium]|jgi:hypothetical protein|nr:hypothetical protein [Puniceicoccales bacterium]
MSSDPTRDYWLFRARRLVWRVNFAWWLSRFAPPAFAISMMALLPLLLLRGAKVGILPFWVVFVSLHSILALTIAWRVRASGEDTASALARLDNAFSLHTRLSAAFSNVGQWPPIPVGEDGARPLRWKLGRTSALLLAAFALPSLAALAPVGTAQAIQPGISQAPPALEDVRAWARELREEKIIEPDALDALEKKAEELLKGAREKWYKAGTLEAAGHLREQTAQTLQNLDKDLASIENAIAHAAALMDQMPEPLAAALQKSIEEALQGLDLSDLPLKAGQRDLLRQLDMKALIKMTPEQMAALTQAIKSNRAAIAKNGAMRADAKNTGVSADKIPVFLFAPGTKSPQERLAELVGAGNEQPVTAFVTELTDAEKEAFQKEVCKKGILAMAEEGVEGGEVNGLILMPPPSAAGSPDAIKEGKLAAMLGSLTMPAEIRASFTAGERIFLVQAIRDGRIRTSPFSLKENKGECQNLSRGEGGSLCVSLSISMCDSSNGGKGGGPPSPLSLGNPSEKIDVKDPKALSHASLEHASLGDAQGIGIGKHKVNQDDYQGTVNAGALSTDGKGGESAWADNLTPEENSTLRAYFK